MPTKKPAKPKTSRSTASTAIANATPLETEYMDWYKTKKAAPAARQPRRPVIQPAPEGRVTMQKVTRLPDQPKLGRPNDKYLKLCEAVIGEYGAGVPVRLIEFSDPDSAARAVREIRDGRRPVPGGVAEWEFRALVENVEGQDEKGSALYVEWLGEAE